MTFRISINTAGVMAALDDVAMQCEEAARPAAQAMAQVLYDEVRANVGKLKRRSGKLAAAIYQAYSQDNSERGLHTYHVSWNARKAPHGHLVEFGHLQRYEITFDKASGRFITHKDRPLPTPRHVAARPFIRPAAARFSQAQAAGERRFLEVLAEKGVTT